MSMYYNTECFLYCTFETYIVHDCKFIYLFLDFIKNRKPSLTDLPFPNT